MGVKRGVVQLCCGLEPTGTSRWLVRPWVGLGSVSSRQASFSSVLDFLTEQVLSVARKSFVRGISDGAMVVPWCWLASHQVLQEGHKHGGESR